MTGQTVHLLSEGALSFKKAPASDFHVTRDGDCNVKQ